MRWAALKNPHAGNFPFLFSLYYTFKPIKEEFWELIPAHGARGVQETAMGCNCTSGFDLGGRSQVLILITGFPFMWW